MEAVTLKSLSFAYPESEYKALDGVTLSLERGSFNLVMGASAAGKSTLLSLLKREIAPFGEMSGELSVNGSVGFLSQNAEESIVCSSVRAELAFGVENLGKSNKEIELLIAETAAYFNLESKLNSDTASLSGGEKQLVCLAAVMMMKPDVLVLDEPCAMLDPVAAERFVNLIKKLHADFNITVLMSEHSSDLLYSYTDSVILLDNGKMLLCASPGEMLSFLESTENSMLSAVPTSFRFRDKSIIVKSREESVEKGEAALTAKRLWYAYSKKCDVLKDCSLEVYKGKINAVIGCNGCGKTTLLKLLAGVYKPYRGKVKADGRISMLTQSVKDLFTKEKCADEVAFGEITDYLEIGDISERHPYDLSGGQAQRLALAKALERSADIIILDEPTRGLDAVLKKKLGELLVRLVNEGKTVLMVSHDLDFVGEWADFVSFMSDGAVTVTDAKRSFFSSLGFYTTSLSRLTGGKAVCSEDIAYEQ
ncbi:MAG: energy-coupling factor ABC transporter ATP-binding protein [Eubacterium sp.]|nr:energy-coupling factor ABC transporter ATP-binding protein [Eubacterium sp.]